MKNTQSISQSAMLIASRFASATLLAAFVCNGAMAEAVTVSNPWARATVQGQKGAGVFMTLTSTVDTRLMSASSPVAAFGQVHEMRMEGDVMKMHALKEGLEIPAGKTVELKPGSYHVMLMDLKTPLLKETTIPVTLVFIDAKGVETKTELTVPVNAMAHMQISHTSN